MTLRLLTAGGNAAEAALVARIDRSASGLCVARRCVDVADLIATATTGAADVALVWPDLRRLDREAVRRLSGAEVAVLGVRTEDPASVERLVALGVDAVVAADVDLAELTRLVIGSLAGRGHPVTDADVPATSTRTGEDGPSGRLVAVWGPTGAPGRTTVAVTLADELARLGTSALLADADVWGAAVAPVLGLLDESPGLAAAARLANTGALDLPALARLAPEVTPGLRVLTGIARPDRWPELRPAALEVVWSLARRLAATTVVDCGFALEAEDALAFDSGAPRRNGATFATLEQADLVLAVGAADPVGVARLVRGLDSLAEVAPTTSVRVVLNRVRRGSVGPAPERQLVDAIARHSSVDVVALVPDDRDACDQALRHGRTLAEVAPTSPARLALADLAAALAGRAARPRRRGLPRGA